MGQVPDRMARVADRMARGVHANRGQRGRRRPHAAVYGRTSGRAGRLKAFTLQPLALQLAGAANRFGRLAGTALGRLFVVPPQLHLAEDSFPLHLLLERLQRLIDIVVAHQDLHLAAYSFSSDAVPDDRGAALYHGARTFHQPTRRQGPRASPSEVTWLF
jgi:hypothetical protein